MVDALRAVLARWEADDAVRAVVLSGAGDRGLCAGAVAIERGFADLYGPRGDLDALTAAIVSDGVESALARHAVEPPSSELAAQRDWIDDCFSGETVEDIVAALRGHDAPANDAANL